MSEEQVEEVEVPVRAQEDEAEIRDIFRLYLEQAGYTVLEQGVIYSTTTDYSYDNAENDFKCTIFRQILLNIPPCTAADLQNPEKTHLEIRLLRIPNSKLNN